MSISGSFKKIYYTSSEAYLERASELLVTDSHENLFYAAYELRCFVEERQNQYLTAQEQYRSSLPKAWKIGQQAKELKRIYSKQAAQKITIVFQDGYEFVTLYVPVSLILKSKAEKLGRLLHVPKTNLDKAELDKIAMELNEIHTQAKYCQSGNLLAPMLVDLKSNRPIGNMALEISQEEHEKLMPFMTKGTEHLLKVEYLDL